jgi:dextranase
VSELLPTKASFRESEAVEIELRGVELPTTLSVWRLDRKLDEVVVDTPVASLGRLPAGGYGVEADADLRTAVEVRSDGLGRFRYGFVADFAPGRDVRAVADNVRRLHLNAVQFYDWMYRHAGLLPPDDEFDDALGRRVSLETVRRLVTAVQGAGAAALGYAAVYAVGREHRETWADAALCHADGSPWMLADFLWIVDPGDERWLHHLVAELASARTAVGFDGFHLDQYGAPKLARRLDGSIVDLSAAFPVLIERVRKALPDATLVFNNVNDFPTWSTARTSQDGVYIEVWSPHDRLDHLAGLVEKACALAPGKPVCLAAYLSSYARNDSSALEAMRLELATVFSHGASCLLHGEDDAILVDPYYVRHEHLDEAGVRSARALYDFGVRYDGLLFDALDHTRSHLGGINSDVRVTGSVAVATDCIPGAVWARVLDSAAARTVSLIDLTAQHDVAWDAPKTAGHGVAGLTVSFQRVGSRPPRIFAASPDAPTARRLDSSLVDGHDVVRVPTWSTWTLVWADRLTA